MNIVRSIWGAFGIRFSSYPSHLVVFTTWSAYGAAETIDLGQVGRFFCVG